MDSPPHTFSQDDKSGVTHREKLSKLRLDWYKDGSKKLDAMVHSSSTQDSGLGSGLGIAPIDDGCDKFKRTLCDNPLDDRKQSRTALDTDNVVLCIKEEAEISQHIADMISSTDTMKHYKTVYDDLTYRRRGAQAKKKLSSYSPRAPEASKWGVLFDRLIARLKGNTDNDEFDTTRSIKLDNKTDSYHSVSSDTQPDTKIDDQLTVLNKLYMNKTTSHQPPTNEHIDRDGSLSGSCSNTASYWEENWISNSPTPFESVNPSSEELCDICSDRYQLPANETKKITLCYKNHGIHTLPTALGCAGGGVNHWSDESPYFHNLSTSCQELRSILVRRADLATFTFPLAPIRKTDSNHLVWIERESNSKEAVEKSFQYTAPKFRQGGWKRFKAFFGIK